MAPAREINPAGGVPEMNLPTRLLALAAGLALATSVAQAQETNAPSTKSTNTLSDRKVVRDPVTGLLRQPTTEEDAELRALPQALPPAPLLGRRPTASVERRADGSATGKRTLAQMQNLIVETSPEGKVTIRHGELSSGTPAKQLPDAIEEPAP